MKGLTHKIMGFAVFCLFYYFKIFPASVNEHLSSIFNVITSIIIVLLFSGGRIDSKNLFSFGLSADNDYHKKMKRDWLFHSAVMPTLAVILVPNPAVIIASFFYTTHVAFDLLNTHSWDGNKNTYIGVFITVILFYILVYI